MGRKMQNIYEYLSDFKEEEIDYLISFDLTLEDKILLSYRYGNDLHNPVKNDNFTQEQRKYFYNYLVPKMRKMLLERKNKKLDINKQLLDLINGKKSSKEICEILNISNEQLYNLLLELRNSGMIISKKYYSDGSIKYKKANSLNDSKEDKAIITDSKENDLKLLVISDLHFGNTLERVDLINQAYEYCIKNNINIILSCGDLIDGAFSRVEQKIRDLHEQIEYFIKNYPYDKNILTFSVAGDHDYSILCKSSLDIIEICNNFRHDVVIGGYRNTQLNLKNDSLLLCHYINGEGTIKKDIPIILHGHLHKYNTNYDMKNNSLNIIVPSLSDMNDSIPTALELDLSFTKGYIDNVIVKQIYFGNKDIILNELAFDLLSNRTVNFEVIRNIEPYKTYILGDKKQLIKK